MDLNTVVETFVVVVTGGLGSIGGAFLAALLIGQVHSFGTLLFPQATLVLVFVTMGLVLALRPHGLLGRALAPLAQEQGARFQLWPLSGRHFQGACVLAAAMLWLVCQAGTYWPVTG
jgi:branched-chain amino acid transport system permease protein